MTITIMELKRNLGKYLQLAATEDIYITRNGKVVAKLSNPHQDTKREPLQAYSATAPYSKGRRADIIIGI